MHTDRIERAQTLIGYRFNDPVLLIEALTHPSYAAEHGGLVSYQRLEFLGDAVLGFVIAEHLYRALPGEPEGRLTHSKNHVVSGKSLADAACSLGLDEVVFLGKGVSEEERGRSSILEDVFEAVLGAVYLDGGIEAAVELAVGALGTRLGASSSPSIDPKSALQQHTQATGGGLPHYRVVKTTGPAHLREFTVEVIVDDTVVGLGLGPSKQAAEKAAASDALASMAPGSGGIDADRS